LIIVRVVIRWSLIFKVHQPNRWFLMFIHLRKFQPFWFEFTVISMRTLSHDFSESGTFSQNNLSETILNPLLQAWCKLAKWSPENLVFLKKLSESNCCELSVICLFTP
jgi:hypothetical protein